MTEDPQKPNVLGYQPPRDDAQRRTKESAMPALGAVSTVVATWFAMVGWVVANIPIVGAPRPAQIVGPLIVTTVAVVLLGTPSLILWRRGRRGFAMGSLIGLGIALLLLGLCFVVR